MTSASARVQPTRSLFLCEIKPFLYYKCGHKHWNSAHFECMQQRDVDGYQLEDLCACSSPSTPFCQSCNGSAHVKRRLTFDDYSSMAAAGSTILFAKLGPNNLPWELVRDLEASSDGFFVDPSKRNRDWDLWVGTEGWRSHTHYDLQVRSGHSGAYDLRA